MEERPLAGRPPRLLQSRPFERPPEVSRSLDFRAACARDHGAEPSVANREAPALPRVPEHSGDASFRSRPGAGVARACRWWYADLVMVLAALEAAALATRREQLLGLQRAGYTPEVAQLPDKLGALRAAAQVFEEGTDHHDGIFTTIRPHDVEASSRGLTARAGGVAPHLARNRASPPPASDLLTGGLCMVHSASSL